MRHRRIHPFSNGPLQTSIGLLCDNSCGFCSFISSGPLHFMVSLQYVSKQGEELRKEKLTRAKFEGQKLGRERGVVLDGAKYKGTV